MYSHVNNHEQQRKEIAEDRCSNYQTSEGRQVCYQGTIEIRNLREEIFNIAVGAYHTSCPAQNAIPEQLWGEIAIN